MKKNILIISCFLVLGTTFTTLFISSCSKDEVANNTKSEESNNILTFKDLKEYSEVQKSVLSMNTQELKEYEESKGYISFGRLCDEFYFSINPEDFKSVEEVKSFVAKNSKYLRLTEDENGELTMETVLSNSSDRYFLNSDKMFIINGTVYKVFEEGIASTCTSNMEKLKIIRDPNRLLYQNEADISFIPSTQQSSKPELVLKDAAYNCGGGEGLHVSNGNERTRIDLSIEYSGYITAKPHIIIRPLHRVAFVWYYCYRTLSCDIKVAIDTYYTEENRDFYYSNIPSTYDTKIEWTFIEYWYTPEDPIDIHYGGYDCWGDSPETAPAAIMCNGELFY